MPRAGTSQQTVGAALARLGLTDDTALVLHLPLRYEDETRITPIAELVPGQWAQVEGVIVRSDMSRGPRRQLVATLCDAAGDHLTLRWLHVFPGQQRQVAVGRHLRVRGDVRAGLLGLEMVHPRTRTVTLDETPESVLPASLTPVYPTTDGLSQPVLSRRIKAAVERMRLPEVLPQSLLDALGLMPLEPALRLLHAPPPDADVEALIHKHHPAWRRIKFEELLAQQLSLAKARAQRRQRRAPPGIATGTLHERLSASLPFALTRAQQRAAAEIDADLGRPWPMQRLLQGDVGSGKTVVAALAAARAIDAGWQVALMAPTEILAEQHYRKIASWLEPLGVAVAWLTGSQGARERRESLAALADGRARLVIGTHALIQDKVVFDALGLAIIDEQHRFGVGQRLTLRSKRDDAYEAHQLMMSATPIPRSLAMTAYADLDVSVIDELPPGRSPIVTKLIHDARRAEVIAAVNAQARQGRQVYWVCPLIEESESLELQTAVETYAALSDALPGLRVGLVHGRLSASEKATVMAEFKNGQIDVLVATTVIEVGVDVPNASLMVIEHAERFGLAQLHQLRGRVGRGSQASVCVLIYQTPLSRLARERLRILHASQDGFAIAQRDLELRGPGELLGARQSGALMMRHADLLEDHDLALQARDWAAWLLEHAPDAANAHLQRWLAQRESYLRA